MLSQQRGPASALKYARERERLLKGAKDGGRVRIDAVADEDGDGDGKEEEGAQKVAVLQGGFEGWIRAYVFPAQPRGCLSVESVEGNG